LSGSLRVLGAFVLLAVVVLAAVFAYYIWTPLPSPPTLSGVAKQNSLLLDGHTRSFIEYAPTKLPANASLVIVLHGASMDGALMRRMTGYEFDRLADTRGFVVLYPDAFRGNWNDCRVTMQNAARREHIDDVGFVRALIAREKSQRGVDPKKVYVAGFSNGGHMALNLAVLPQSPVAGIAVFASSLSTPRDSTCPPNSPTPPVMIVDGTADPIHPFGGGEVNIFGLQRRGVVLGAEASARALVARNGLAASSAMTMTLPHRDVRDPTSVKQISWSRNGQPYIVLYEVIGGGHVVPQRIVRFPRLFGTTTHDLDGPAAAIEFFFRPRAQTD
jgi:polyhydroxybutyrate depolymerase